jgi:hypothetical protein
VVCSDKYRAQVEEVIVEGRSDATGFTGVSPVVSLNRNLRLSQQRAMEVVNQSVLPLEDDQATRTCLEEKMTASGRGTPEDQTESGDSRRVEFKIKLRSEAVMAALKQARLLNASKLESAERLQPAPEVLKVLELFSELREVPRRPVSFEMSERELNVYLEYALRQNPRPGLESIKVEASDTEADGSVVTNAEPPFDGLALLFHHRTMLDDLPSFRLQQ